jgi:hypothetical protein
LFYDWLKEKDKLGKHNQDYLTKEIGTIKEYAG